MAKLTLSDLATITGNEPSAITTINNNSAAIETALENTLSRDGTTPNTMSADLDMNGQDILNVGNIVINGDILEGNTVTEYIEFTETTTPATPDANKLRLYARDNNSRTELTYINSDGDNTDLLRNMVFVEEFGAVGDAGAGGNTGTDDTAAFQAAIDYVSARGGGIVDFKRKGYLLNSTLTIKKNVTLRGPIEMPGQVLPVATASYDDLGGVLYVNSAGTISMQWSAGLQNCYILRKGLVTPYADQTAATAGLAAFAGTAVTITNHDCTLSNLLILGFAQAVYSGGGSLPARPRLDYVCCDCTAGILIDGCADVGHLNFCHAFPYLTTGRGFTDATNTRSGIAFAFHTQADWCKMTNCFAYGFAVGFDIDSIGIGTIVGCGADYPGPIASTSIGYRVTGTDPRQANFIMCVAGAQGTGWSIDNGLSSSDGGAVSLTNCRGFANDGVHVDVISGRLIATGCVFRNGTIGIQAASTAGALTIAGNEFENLTTPLSLHATPKALSQIYGNRTRSVTNAIDELVNHASSTAATGALRATNTNDSNSVQVARFDGDRATPTNNDTAYISYFMSDAAGTQTEVHRHSWRISDTTDASEDSNVFWSLVVAGSLVGRLLLTGTSLGPTGNDNLALGASGLAWSDLFLADGGVIDWNAGNTTLVQSANTLTTNARLVSSRPTGGIGYSTGAGGTVTQATNKSTGVTLNTVCGAITMNNAALAAGTIVSFTLTNSAIAATDVLVLNHISGGTVGSYTLNAQAAAGSATINVRNNTAGSLGEAIVIQFAVIKGVNA